LLMKCSDFFVDKFVLPASGKRMLSRCFTNCLHRGSLQLTMS
jgi:hypothetical protein